MGVIYARVDNKLEKRFRIEVARKFGGERGALSKAVAEAIKLWLKENQSD